MRASKEEIETTKRIIKSARLPTPDSGVFERPPTQADIRNAHRINHVYDYALGKNKVLGDDIRSLLRHSEKDAIEQYRLTIAVARGTRKKRIIKTMLEYLGGLRL
ncbi:Uncharacterised protein [Candidatus Norongarragalina meridionalis]|nr:Uncharacterised protein [Candidatus Norongarragalina meridionalis]